VKVHSRRGIRKREEADNCSGLFALTLERAVLKSRSWRQVGLGTPGAALPSPWHAMTMIPAGIAARHRGGAPVAPQHLAVFFVRIARTSWTRSSGCSNAASLRPFLAISSSHFSVSDEKCGSLGRFPRARLRRQKSRSRRRIGRQSQKWGALGRPRLTWPRFRPPGFGVVGYNVQGRRRGDGPPKLWRGRTTYSEVFETARDTSKATAKVARGCELCFDRLSRAVGSG
jgi:hypothetical protein